MDPTRYPRIKVSKDHGRNGSASLGPSDARGTDGPLNSHRQNNPYIGVPTVGVFDGSGSSDSR